MKRELSITLISLTLIALIALSVSIAHAADAPQAKLSPSEITQLNQIALEAQIADLQKQLSQLKQTLIIHDACWANKIPKEQCSPQADGTLKAPTPPSPLVEKTPLTPR